MNAENQTKDKTASEIETLERASTKSGIVMPLPRQTRGIQPTTFGGLVKYAEYIADSELVPKDYRGKPANVLLAMQWGSELGMSNLQALQNIAVINGRPSIWGDMIPALVKAHPSYEWMTEKFEEDSTGKVVAAICIGKRRGHPEPEERKFTLADAKQAGLLNDQTKFDAVWKKYTKRMLQVRARAWLARDLWPDALRGLNVAEEMMDVPDVTYARGEASPGKVAVAAIAHEESPERELLVADLNAIADEGTERFAEHWASISKEKRAMVADLVESFQARADAADKAVQS